MLSARGIGQRGGRKSASQGEDVPLGQETWPPPCHRGGLHTGGMNLEVFARLNFSAGPSMVQGQPHPLFRFHPLLAGHKLAALGPLIVGPLSGNRCEGCGCGDSRPHSGNPGYVSGLCGSLWSPWGTWTDPDCPGLRSFRLLCSSVPVSSCWYPRWTSCQAPGSWQRPSV